MFLRGQSRACVHAGDTLEVREYERLLPLKAETAALGSLKGMRKEDCMVAFSRGEVHAIKCALGVELPQAT